MRVLLNAEQVQLGLAQIASQICQRHPDPVGLLLVGIRRGGTPIAAALADLMRTNHGREVAVGAVDITLYRDDAASALPNPRIGPSQLPMDIGGLRIILVDDVLHTRRTIRAALDAVLDYGRPARIELAVLVDRPGGELPIQADYWVTRTEDVAADERIDVGLEAGRLVALVQSKSAPSLPPPPTR
jgi:pyrimidine operon attenuation protein / uracil phosphoribosyltransferase